MIAKRVKVVTEAWESTRQNIHPINWVDQVFRNQQPVHQNNSTALASTNEVREPKILRVRLVALMTKISLKILKTLLTRLMEQVIK